MQLSPASKPDDNLSFPVLTSGVSFQHPGRNTAATCRHAALPGVRGERTAPAHGGPGVQQLQAHRFQAEIHKLGFLGVFNHSGKRKPGKDATIGDAVLVDGFLFVKWMPRNIMTSTGDFAKKLITKDEHIAHIEARRKYALALKGRPDEDGYHRFTYPPLTGLMLFDPTTGDRLKRTPRLAAKTLMAPPRRLRRLSTGRRA